MAGDLFAPTHLILLLIVVLLVFGPKRLPDMGRSLGNGLRELKGGLAGHDDQPSERPPAATTPTESPVSDETTKTGLSHSEPR